MEHKSQLLHLSMPTTSTMSLRLSLMLLRGLSIWSFRGLECRIPMASKLEVSSSDLWHLLLLQQLLTALLLISVNLLNCCIALLKESINFQEIGSFWKPWLIISSPSIGCNSISTISKISPKTHIISLQMWIPWPWKKARLFKNSLRIVMLQSVHQLQEYTTASFQTSITKKNIQKHICCRKIHKEWDSSQTTLSSSTTNSQSCLQCIWYFC